MSLEQIGKAVEKNRCISYTLGVQIVPALGQLRDPRQEQLKERVECLESCILSKSFKMLSWGGVWGWELITNEMQRILETVVLKTDP